MVCGAWILRRAASFAAIKPGTLLYEVHAISDPAATPVHIGNLYSDSDYVPSKFGDTQLFFEHARVRRAVASLL